MNEMLFVTCPNSFSGRVSNIFKALLTRSDLTKDSNKKTSHSLLEAGDSPKPGDIEFSLFIKTELTETSARTYSNVDHH